MPRTGGVYTAPAGTKGVPNTTIQSAPYNALIDDLVQDANAARPITAGGTGATNATDARTNLGALASADLLTAATKAVPVDNDTLLITDSEDTGKLKRVLWSVIKAKLRTLFDNIYQARLVDQAVIELNANQATASGSFIDFHAQPGSDFDARIARNQGANGTFDFFTNGSGQMRFYANGGFYFNNAVTVNGRITGVGELWVQSGSAPGNAHLYMTAEDGFTVRGILYANTAKQVLIATNGGAQTFTFGTDGTFFAAGALVSNSWVYSGGVGGASLRTDGNIAGAVWNNWGSGDAFSAINIRIEARGSAYYTSAVGQIMPTVAAQGAGAVGTYAMLKTISGVAPEPGTVKSGSELQFTNANGDGSGSPSGSWLCCGRSLSTTAVSSGAVTIFLKRAA